MEVKGEIIFIGEVQTISEKFRKRECVVKTDGQYPQEILVQFVQDKCELLNVYQVGSFVNCHINLRGKSFVGTDGIKKWFNSIDCWKIELQGQGQVTNQTPPPAKAQVIEKERPF